MLDLKFSAAMINRHRTAIAPFAAALLAAHVFAAVQAQAQTPQASPQARIVVIGEGSVRVVPDRAQISAGVTTRAKSAKEAADANNKTMTAIIAALTGAGIAQKDIQTARFSIQPIYSSIDSKSEPPRLTGYSVSNQLGVTIGRLDKIGEILDSLVTAGATDLGGIEFLVSDHAKYLDEAREAAIADAKRKAAIYAKAAGLNLGPVIWITEDSNYVPPIALARVAAPAVKSAVPIAAGEESLNARVTVGFDVAAAP